MSIKLFDQNTADAEVLRLHCIIFIGDFNKLSHDAKTSKLPHLCRTLILSTLDLSNFSDPTSRFPSIPFFLGIRVTYANAKISQFMGRVVSKIGNEFNKQCFFGGALE